MNTAKNDNTQPDSGENANVRTEGRRLGRTAKKDAKKNKRPPLERVTADPDAGLTAEQVAVRVKLGYVNSAVKTPTKSVPRIVLTNIFTYFNVLFFIIAGVLIAFGSYRQLTFLMVVFSNTAIGIIQELSAKKTLDRMNILAAPKAEVVRDGSEQTVPTDGLVRDDIVIFSTGSQICADAEVVAGEVSVNESLVTGESDEITRRPGDRLISGAYVVSGKCRARLERVGSDSFVSQLTLNAKKMRSGKPKGMMKSLTTLVQIIGVVLIPLSAAMYIKEVRYIGATPKDAVTATAGSVLGMIPEGLYLLTSVALAVSVVRLAQKRTLCHDLGCIETLARVDTLCVDKTGTITENAMTLTGVVPIAIAGEDEPRFSEASLRRIISELAANMEGENLTMAAIKAACPAPSPRRAEKVIGFSSAYKYSAVSFGGIEKYVLGAPEFVLRGDYPRYRQTVERYASSGARVLMLAVYHGELDGGALSAAVSPIGLVTLVNNIRPQAAETFRYFGEQGVAVKVISGDNPITVAAAARRAEIPGCDRALDCSAVASPEALAAAADKYTIFGRVTPEQKRIIIRSLRKAGHTVAMTGDGVNDVLALKEADCAIAMASGSEIASQVSHLVLLDSNFASMPAVVAEGRRVINNIERSASLYLVKNIFSLLLTVISIFAVFSYPLSPAQLSLMSTFTIGIPSFFLALQPNKAVVKGNFLKNVIYRSLPEALTNLFVVIGTVMFRDTFGLDPEQMSTISALLLTVVGFIMLADVSKPFNPRRATIFGGSLLLCVTAAGVMPWFFALSKLENGSWLIFVLFAMLAMFLTGTFRSIIEFLRTKALLIFARLKTIKFDDLFLDDDEK